MVAGMTLARSPQSRADDFVHKLRIVLKELNETSIWLRVIAKSQLVRPIIANGHIGREYGVVQNLYFFIEDGSRWSEVEK
jgi:hypothetical protein